MIPIGPHPPRCAVLGGDSLIEALSNGGESGGSLVAERIAQDSTSQRTIQHQEWDCIVIDCAESKPDTVAVVEQCRTETPELPIILLVSDWSDEQITTALAADSIVTLPRALLNTDPTLLAERVVSTVEQQHAQTGLRELYDNIAGIATLHDPDSGKMVHANQSLCDLLGYERSELLSMQIGDFTADVPGYDHDRAMNLVRSATGRDDPIEVEWPLVAVDGSVRWVESQLRPVQIGGRELVLSTAVDITERRRQERKYEQVFDNVNDVITVHDPWNEEIVDVNETLCELTGYSREGLLEMDIDGFSATGEGYTSDRAYEIQQRVAATGEVDTVDWKIATADGGERLLEAVLSPATIAGEDRVLVMARDVTERERRKREYEQIFNLAGDGIVIHDPESGAVVDANKQVAQLLGYDREAVINRPLSEFQATDEGVSDEAAREKISESARKGSQEFEWPLETATGETVWVRARHERGEIGGEERIVAILQNITERRYREEEYEQIFNAVTDTISVHDPETGEMLDCNETLCELLGYDRDEILELGLTGVSVESEGYTAERGFEIVQRVMESGEPETFEWKVETASGEHRLMEVNATPATINGEERYLGLSRDITERRRSERRLSEILDRIDEAILMTEADTFTVDPRAADYVTAGHEAIWGQSFEEICDKHDDGVLGTIHVDDVDEYRAYVDGIVDDISTNTAENKYAIEYRIERPDGETRWVQSEYYPIEWERNRTGIVVVSRDITARKDREQRIAAFDDATAELANADTPEEATKTAVEAATETLQLQAVGVFLYDNDTGVLHPEALAGPLPDAIATEPIEPRDDPLWGAFAAGTIVASDGGQHRNGIVGETDATPTALSNLEEWRALALGNHGLLLIGSLTNTLDAETIQSAHILAATLEAALNHLKGRQQLAAQEDRLESQTRRIERLDRIARLTQQVEAAITDASTPGEIERAICDRLANSGPYALAWIGGLDVGSDQLTPHAVVGVSDLYVERLQLKTTSETADPHPALAAWRRDEPQVTDSIIGDGPADNWRQEALAEGYQSLCAVPLTYDGITHGVLTVGTDSPGDFGDREREVLSQLGTAIGNAIAAIERRRALESDETIELEFRGPGDALPFAQVAEKIGCEVRHERTVSRQDSSLSVYYKIAGEFTDDMLDSVRGSFRGSVEIVTEDSSTLVEVKTDHWFGSPLAEYGGILREAIADPDETTLTVEVPKQADVRSFTERLQAEAPSLELTAKRQHQRQQQTPAELHDQIRTELTDRQFEVLQTAVSAGYFEWPRENDGSDIAETLDITQPTVNKHLRLAEKQIFSLLMESAE